jgi:hypothetical protein
MFASRHITGMSEFHYGLGFAAAPKVQVRAGLGSGEIRYSPSCLDLGLAGRLAHEAELGASKPRYDAVMEFAVTRVTVLGEALGKRREGQLTKTGHRTH